MLKTILFDLDGTLLPLDQEEFIRSYIATLLRRLVPMGYDGEKLTAALWKGTAAMIRNDGQRTNRQVFWEVFTGELGMQALALESNLDDFYRREFDEVRRVLRRQADHGPLIRGLRGKGYSVVLATSPMFPAAAVETRLRWVGLRSEDFDYITTYENCRRSKPDPGYFRDILDHVGRLPEECLMVGNNPVDDMAAREAGLAVYLVTDFPDNPEGRPAEDFPHGSFQELTARLEGRPPLTGRP